MATPIEIATEVMTRARARWQQARQTGDEVEIEIARCDLTEAMKAVDVLLDDFERDVLQNRFQRKRDMKSKANR